MNEILESVIVETGADAVASVIWLHGLGADGHDFEPIVPELDPGCDQALRFVFPHAPMRPVTINAGVPVRAWFDILGLDRQSHQDEEGIRHSQQLIERLIEDERDRGFSYDRIFLAGFSQGGALALHTGLRYPKRLAGFIGLSCYLPLHMTLADERSDSNLATKLFMAHGTFDSLVTPDLGDAARTHLAELGYDIEWHTYPMAHQVCAEEIADIRNWLTRVLRFET